MVFFGYVLVKLSTLCSFFTVGIAHDGQRNTSSTPSITTDLPRLKTISEIPKLIASSNLVFTVTPPFDSQTFVSISLPPCHPHDRSMSPLGCREPSTSASFTALTASSSSIGIPAATTSVVWKTVRVTVTKTRTVFPPPRTTVQTQTYNTQGTQLSYRAESITRVDHADRFIIAAITTVTSVLDSWGIPQEPDTFTPTPASPKLPSQHAPARLCSANTAQWCEEIGGRTFVVTVSNGHVVPATDSVLHSTATESLVEVITSVSDFSTLETSRTLSMASRRGSISSSVSPPSTGTSPSSSNSISRSSSSLSSTPSQSLRAQSSGLRKMKNPWLLLAVCCAGAMMFEMGVWTERTKQEQAKDSNDENETKGEMSETKAVHDEETEDTSVGEVKENVDDDMAGEMLGEWHII
ncbi:hypothetical protein ONS95_001910 [Cadophora gregata]|uniref:uncharacterized protein n=1 Tax=Cadophora gregata TaxID=51156 RepID=UPI0026DDC334|nr:uncharacterized protein ONS95_001910 [Cadophora gregata]KAK0111560.1 hypothetical protein ONS95_001910 [Cadophora gregata]KAK0111966.1 hypothetical protein ONS96_001229 [Cadophora gregata f. sp. sojae]